MRKLLALLFSLAVLALLPLPVFAPEIDINQLAANSSLLWDDYFVTNEDVWIRTPHIGTYCAGWQYDKLQNPPPPPVDVYVVKDKNNWKDGDSLSPYLAKKTVAPDPNGLIPADMIWQGPLVTGNFDMIIDFSRDGFFNDSMGCQEKVDKNESVGFWVMGSGSTTSAGGGAEGEAIPDHGYWNDSADKPYNEMLHLLVRPTGEAVELNGITLKASGTGDDRADISRIDIVNDKNGNGAYDPATDVIVATGTYQADNALAGIVICPPDLQNYSQRCPFTVADGATGHLLVVYEIKNLISGKTYSFTVLRVNGMGQNSGQVIELLPSLVNGATKTTYNPACKGGMSLQFSPNPVYGGGNASAQVINGTLIAGCDGSEVRIMKGGCDTGTLTAKCNISSGGCTAPFNAPGAAGAYDFWACIDKDGDGKYVSMAESFGPFRLQVNTLEACRPDSIAGCTNKADCESNGGGWCSGDSNCKAAASIACQPPESSGLDKWCTPACTWSSCAGTDSNCFSSTGKCQACKSGEACQNFQCNQTQQQPPATCNGVISLTASFADKKIQVITNTVHVTGSNPSQCGGKVIGFREGSCNGTAVGVCLINGATCTVSWAAPEPGPHTYAACIDINGDGKYNDSGESKLVTVTVPSAETRDLYMWIIAVIIAAVLAVLMYYFLFYRNKKKAEAAPAPPPEPE